MRGREYIESMQTAVAVTNNALPMATSLDLTSPSKEFIETFSRLNVWRNTNDGPSRPGTDRLEGGSRDPPTLHEFAYKNAQHGCIYKNTKASLMEKHGKFCTLDKLQHEATYHTVSCDWEGCEKSFRTT